MVYVVEVLGSLYVSLISYPCGGGFVLSGCYTSRLYSSLVFLGSHTWRLVPQNVEVRLDEVTALSNVLGSLHLVPGEHPDLNVGPQQVPDCLGDLVLEPV